MTREEAMSDKVKPALTPEQWESQTTSDIWLKDGVPWSGEAYDEGPLADALGTAALILSVSGPDGKPLFTWEHVAAIRRLIPHFDGFLIGEGPSGTSVHHIEAGVRDPSEVAAEAADLLESLLPSRETKP